MQPQKADVLNNQGSLFQPQFSDLLDQSHPLYRLSGEIDWSIFEETMGGFFDPGQGRPALPVRLMVGQLKNVFEDRIPKSAI